MRAVVLVEGESDRNAVEALAARRGRDLAAEGVAVEAVVAAQGELRSFRVLQRQPAQRGVPIEAQLRRFMGTHSGRKIQYGRLLVEALDLARVPRPLDLVLARVGP